VLGSPEADLDEAVRIIRADESLTASVLRAANSAALGARGRTLDLRAAVVRLGARAVSHHALELAAAPAFRDAGIAFDVRRGEQWRAAIGGARAAEELGIRCGAEPERCFVAALLRDIGRLAFDLHRAQHGWAVPRPDGDENFLTFEQRAFGVDHATVGAELATRWGLPTEVCHAIRHHHDPPARDEGGSVLLDVVHLADAAARFAGLGLGCDGLLYPVSTAAMDRLGVDRDDLERLALSAAVAVFQLESELGGEDGDAPRSSGSNPNPSADIPARRTA
jgi:putative nucleotidyltransferase with HDIG domain